MTPSRRPSRRITRREAAQSFALYAPIEAQPGSPARIFDEAEIAEALVAKPARTKRNAHPEGDLQRLVVVALNKILAPGVLYWFTPNGSANSTTRMLLAAMGARAGVPDLTFVWVRIGELGVTPSGIRVGFVELKSPGGTMSDAQDQFFGAATAIGCQWALCRSLEDVMLALRAWGVPVRGRLT